MTHRIFNFGIAALGLVILAIPLAVILFLVWKQDRRSPFYVADRVGCGGRPFRMVKIRSMVVGADRNGVESTSANDSRITGIGHFVRRWKIDEISQLWNVLLGDMNLVGPRPNTVREVRQYTTAERELLSVKPGITDIASIVFSDEGEILREAPDPDQAYAVLIRPWKSTLGLIYVRNTSVLLDLKLIWLTIVGIIDKRRALDGVGTLLLRYDCDDQLREVAARRHPLREFASRAPLPIVN